MVQDFRNIRNTGREATVDGEVISSSSSSASTYADAAVQRDSGNKVLRNTYLLLSVSMVPALLGGFLGRYFFPVSLLQSPILFFIGFVAVFYGMIFAIEKNNTNSFGVVLLQVFTFSMGFMSGPLLMMASSYSNGPELVSIAFGGTAAIFFSMAMIASSIKRPLTGLGNFLAVGGIILMIGIVASLFLNIPAFHLALLCGILLFSVLAMLWRLNMAHHAGNANYISLTLGLVIDLYNIFTILLRLLMIFAGRRD